MDIVIHGMKVLIILLTVDQYVKKKENQSVMDLYHLNTNIMVHVVPV